MARPRKDAAETGEVAASGRPTRSDTVRMERRHRDEGTLDRLQRSKLALPVALRGDTDHEYRWVNDEGTRIYDLTREGEWDVVSLDKSEAGDADKVRKPVGKNADGTPLYAQLCRIPKWIAEEDRKVRINRLAEVEQQVLTSPTPAPEDSRSGDTAYVASPTQISRGKAAAYTP